MKDASKEGRLKNRTMGFAKTPLNPPEKFLKKSNHQNQKNALTAAPFKYAVFLINWLLLLQNIY